jgi:hypothetical protein
MSRARGVAGGLLLAACLPALLAACGGGGGPSSRSDDPLKAAAAASFEKLDNTYFAASQAALAKRKTIAPDATQQAINGLVDANHAFVQGLQDIPFPDGAKADATSLLDASVQVEADVVLLAQTGNSPLSTDLDKRNAADRVLRKNLGLDPNEVPAPGA